MKKKLQNKLNDEKIKYSTLNQLLNNTKETLKTNKSKLENKDNTIIEKNEIIKTLNEKISTFETEEIKKYNKLDTTIKNREEVFKLTTIYRERNYKHIYLNRWRPGKTDPRQWWRFHMPWKVDQVFSANAENALFTFFIKEDKGETVTNFKKGKDVGKIFKGGFNAYIYNHQSKKFLVCPKTVTTGARWHPINYDLDPEKAGTWNLSGMKNYYEGVWPWDKKWGGDTYAAKNWLYLGDPNNSYAVFNGWADWRWSKAYFIYQAGPDIKAWMENAFRITNGKKIEISPETLTISNEELPTITSEMIKEILK